MTKFIITFAASLAALTAIPAQAKPSEGATATVSYADLRLDRSDGVDALDRRIRSAVDSICGKMEGHPAFDAGTKRCQDETMAQVQPSRDFAIASYGDRRFAFRQRKIRLAAR